MIKFTTTELRSRRCRVFINTVLERPGILVRPDSEDIQRWIVSYVSNDTGLIVQNDLKSSEFVLGRDYPSTKYALTKF